MDTHSIHPSFLTASVLFLCSVAQDGLSSLDPVHSVHSSHSDAPSSLRATAIVLIATVASPPVSSNAIVTQRLVLSALLVAVAVGGEHVSGQATRIADAIFVLVIGLFSVSAMYTDSRTPYSEWKTKVSSFAAEVGWRDGPAALASACLLYSGARIVRHAALYTHNAVSFGTEVVALNSTTVVPAYSSTNVASVLATSSGGTCAALAAMTLLFSKTLRDAMGDKVDANIFVVTGFFVFLTAFWGMLAQTEQFAQLPVLFGDEACVSQSCPLAGKARRFALINGTVAPLWFVCVGMFVIAYESRRDGALPQERTSADGRAIASFFAPSASLLSLLCCVAVVAVVFAHSSFEGDGAYIELCTLGCIAGIAIAGVFDVTFGTLVFAAAMTFGEITQVLNTSLVDTFKFFTHCSLITGTAILFLRNAVSVVTETMWSRASEWNTTIRVLDDVVGVLSIASLSIFSFLFIASNQLLVTYEGHLFGADSFSTGPKKYARTYNSLIMQHFLPLLAVLPVRSTAQYSNVSWGWRVVVWIVGVGIPLGVWFAVLTLSATDASSIDIYSWLDDPFFVAAGVIGIGGPWLSLAFA